MHSSNFLFFAIIFSTSKSYPCASSGLPHTRPCMHVTSNNISVSPSEGQQQHTNTATCSTNECTGVTCSWLVNYQISLPNLHAPEFIQLLSLMKLSCTTSCPTQNMCSCSAYEHILALLGRQRAYHVCARYSEL